MYHNFTFLFDITVQEATIKIAKINYLSITILDSDLMFMKHLGNAVKKNAAWQEQNYTR